IPHADIDAARTVSRRCIMQPRTSSERMADAMRLARHHWQALRKTEAGDTAEPAVSPPHFTIALSREAGAGGALVARAVGERLRWPVYDRELLERVAAEMGQRTDLLESLDEKRHGWLVECLEAFASAPAVSEGAFVRHLLEALLSLAAHGDCVIVGRGAAQ